jgi:hypothetical protein
LRAVAGGGGGAWPWPRGAAGTAVVDNSVTVSMTGPVNASDPADVQRFLDQVAAAAAAGQASAANTAPAVLVGGS